MSNLDALNSVLDYILEHEMSDFYENPSKNHVYYSALLCRFGLSYADNVLKVAVKSL